MKIILSPAKKMKHDNDYLLPETLPIFINKADTVYQTMQSMNAAQLQHLWKCNDAIARLNIERLHTYSLSSQLTPAILAYEDIQYQYMAPHLLNKDELQYLNNHLIILSGLYGMLRPMDGVIPYRLEMQAKLNVAEHKNMYEFWGESIASHLYRESDVVINLASKEYSKVISPFVPNSKAFITCLFKQMHEGKLVEKGTLCKMARGQMVRWLAQSNIKHVEEIRTFHELGYLYNDALSKKDELVFVMID